MNEETLQQVQLAYGVENWSAGYFDISTRGTIIVRPAKDDVRYADLKEIVDQVLAKGCVCLPFD